jgi:hypothetical protein
MKISRKEELSLKDFYIKFLQHTSFNLPDHRQLTNMETKILAEFWYMTGELADKDRFSTSAKRYIREKFNFKGYSNLENYITNLQMKGFILKKDDTYIINPNYNLPKGSGDITIEYKYTVLPKEV